MYGATARDSAVGFLISWSTTITSLSAFSQTVLLTTSPIRSGEVGVSSDPSRLGLPLPPPLAGTVS